MRLATCRLLIRLAIGALQFASLLARNPARKALRTYLPLLRGLFSRLS